MVLEFKQNVATLTVVREIGTRINWAFTVMTKPSENQTRTLLTGLNYCSKVWGRLEMSLLFEKSSFFQ
jgi:hypothetical protein